MQQDSILSTICTQHGGQDAAARAAIPFRQRVQGGTPGDSRVNLPVLEKRCLGVKFRSQALQNESGTFYEPDSAGMANELRMIVEDSDNLARLTAGAPQAGSSHEDEEAIVRTLPSYMVAVC